jgi:hypothetical protein
MANSMENKDGKSVSLEEKRGKSKEKEEEITQDTTEEIVPLYPHHPYIHILFFF